MGFRFLSSNPYDFIANNKEYEKLIQMGMEALGALEECLFVLRESFNGLERYLLCIAIEDIVKVDLKKYRTHFWQCGESFRNSWPLFKEEAIYRVPEILSDVSLTEAEKIKAITKYGMLAIEPLESAQDSDLFASSLVNMINVGSRNDVVDIALSKTQWSQNNG